jgi:microcystin-dependent protein
MKIEINISDKLALVLERILKPKTAVILIAIILFCFGMVLFSDQLKEWYVFSPGQIISAEQVNQNFKRLYDRVNQLGIGVPTGTIVAYYGTAAPEGWLLCNGDPIPADDQRYDILKILIGAKTPDLRGRFLRGIDPTAAIDPDGATRSVGSMQADAFQKHFFKVTIGGGNAGFASFSPDGLGAVIPSNSSFPASGTQAFFASTLIEAGTNGVPRTSSETRPKNVAVNFIIKY